METQKTVREQLELLQSILQEEGVSLYKRAHKEDRKYIQVTAIDAKREAKFREGCKKVLSDFFENPNPYASQRKKPDPTRTYDKSTLLTPEGQMIKQLEGLGLDPDCGVVVHSNLSTTAKTDGLMPIPFISDLGRVFEIDRPFNRGYGWLGLRVLEELGKTRRLANEFKKREFEDFQLYNDVREKLYTLECQTNPIEDKVRFFLLPVSMGATLAGYGRQNARITSLLANRLPLGHIQIACLLMGWPERLTAYEELWLLCSADVVDQYSPFESYPSFIFYEGWLDFKNSFRFLDVKYSAAEAYL